MPDVAEVVALGDGDDYGQYGGCGAEPAQKCGSDLLRVIRRECHDVTLGEPPLLTCPANERLRHAHPGGGMLIVELRPAMTHSGCRHGQWRQGRHAAHK